MRFLSLKSFLYFCLRFCFLDKLDLRLESLVLEILDGEVGAVPGGGRRGAGLSVGRLGRVG